jgi:hypothetical protein
MRHSETSPRPLFERMVFLLALLLALILIFHGARGFLTRWSQASPAAGGLTTQAGSGRTSGAVSAAETAVTAIAPIKLSRTGSPHVWRVEVPSPTGAVKKE